jgi:hypothetical protein
VNPRADVQQSRGHRSVVETSEITLAENCRHCGMAYRRFSCWADHGRVTIALAIPMATRHFYMLGSVHVPVSKHIRAAAGGPSA